MPEPELPPAEVLLDQSPACHWIVNSEGVFERVYGDTMPLFGKARSDVAGQPAASVLKPDVLSLWQDRFRRALAGETVLLREKWDGCVWHIDLFPLHLRPGTTHAGCVAREITHCVRADQEQRRAVMNALQAQEGYRAKTAQFLHNVVGQNLAALGLRLDLVGMDLAASDSGVRHHLAEIQSLLESVMEQVRIFSYELNPSAVERIGLRSALERLGTRIQEQYHGAVRLDVDSSIALQPEAAAGLYRIAEQAAENAARHSGCSLIEIAVKSSEQGIWIEIRDNGRGFDPADLEETRRGLGLLSMEHHAATAGMRLSIASSRQRGTVVRVVVPAAEGGQAC